MQRSIIKWLGLILVLVTVLVSSSACEPYAPLRVQNQTDQTLSIYVVWLDKSYYVGDVAPGEEIQNENRNILQFSSFPIEAKDAQGNVVYSKTYTGLELRQKLHWTIVIPPLQNK